VREGLLICDKPAGCFIAGTAEPLMAIIKAPCPYSLQSQCAGVCVTFGWQTHAPIRAARTALSEAVHGRGADLVRGWSNAGQLWRRQFCVNRRLKNT